MNPELFLNEMTNANYITCAANMLYFINSDHDISLKGENGIKATEGGYWFSKTWTQSPTMGRVTTKEFYWGKAPRGEKTVWVMKEYTMDKLLVM